MQRGAAFGVRRPAWDDSAGDGLLNPPGALCGDEQLSVAAPQWPRSGSAGQSALYWVVRGAGFILVLVIFSGAVGSGIGSRHETVTVVQLALIAPLLLVLACLELRDAESVRGDLRELRFLALVALSATGSLTAQLGLASATLAYTLGACYEAGYRFSVARAGAVVGCGILGVLASDVLFGFGLGAQLGWPLVMTTCASLGYGRRVAHERGEQLEGLIAQMRLVRRSELASAALEERHRIAREIHDVLAQSLSALGLQIEAARVLLGDRKDVDGALRRLDHARSLADRGLSESREAIEALRGDSPPLPEALAGLVDSHNRERPGMARLITEGARQPLAPAVTLALIRVTQEALVNAARHAAGARIDVRLRYGQDGTTLEILNACAGTPGGPPTGTSSGYGLAGMRERMAHVGGSLAAGPAPQGWSVMARVPR